MDPNKYCVVCGEGSVRQDWQNVDGEFVACDGHSTGEFKAAVKLKQDEAKAKAEVEPEAPAQ